MLINVKVDFVQIGYKYMKNNELKCKSLNGAEPDNLLILPFLCVGSSSISINLPSVEEGDCPGTETYLE
jgi:hypothetical protein